MKFYGHTFHIPVLGVGYSVDAPAKVAKYGISSVISIVDDILLEQLRKDYHQKLDKPYEPILAREKDSRAKRITAYLNLINEIVKDQFEKLRVSAFEKGSEITKYFELLPDVSFLKQKYYEMLSEKEELIKLKMQKFLRDNLHCGSIDVNIMTKVDKTNYSEGLPLPSEFNDAHAALRGYANSNLESSLIFSAGMNPKLYGYLETFKDFLPQINGSFKKKIVIKVSDFRSALIQGKFLAKKGLWVSEFRIESGLNCGGHAFATDGYLLGPILEEFKNRKEELLDTLKNLFLPSLQNKEIKTDEKKLDINITVQGGVGLSTEHEFLIRNYGVKSVGWGSPFLLVPEVMNVDKKTLTQLSEAKEDDYYLSNSSPLGVPFNSIRNSGKDLERIERMENGKPGSPCPKKFLEFNKDFTDKPICTASISYFKKLDSIKDNPELKMKYENDLRNASDKNCLCEGLSASALIAKKIVDPKQSLAVAICPGPNLAYFSKVATLKEMVDHIYGRINLITHPNRPNMFIKELSLYIDYLHKKIDESINNFTNQKDELYSTFRKNLIDGIEYYKSLIPNITEEAENVRNKIQKDLELLEEKLLSYQIAI
ncbi:hypothetical protein [Stygiobacter electus]|uniref:Uncharacterized protein n=1 Tax=Stygiobacter electus TaxID=3032292 RepID=A0AAE3P4E8_9BACT|nr:hypothetical protein [Stygiobacter electus]MDF1613043.1 hypothetical protein [Stygiobacter electus]